MLILLLKLLTPTASACLWDTDTLAAELAGMPDITTVLTGRFDRHPPAYYEHRLELVQRRLAHTPDQLSAYDDAAVALDRLGRPTEAIAMMEQKATMMEEVAAALAAHTERSPESEQADAVMLAEHRYRLLANQGTFYAHRWLSGSRSPADLAQAITLVEAAIALNPDAHFGREVIQLKALYWLRDAPPLTQPVDILMQPGLLGFEDWTGQTIAAVSSDEVDPELELAIEGLAGLIVLGAAWESPDIHLALSRALNASGQSTLAWMARLRTIELLDAGQRLHQPTTIPVSVIRSTLLDESMMFTNHDASIANSFAIKRGKAVEWRAARQAWVEAGLAAGRHPDTDSSFWDGAP